MRMCIVKRVCITHSYAVISCEILWMPKCILIYCVKENERMNRMNRTRKKCIIKQIHAYTHRMRCDIFALVNNRASILQCFYQMTKTSNLNNVDWLLMHKILSLSNPKYSKVKFSIVSPFFPHQFFIFSWADSFVLIRAFCYCSFLPFFSC